MHFLFLLCKTMSNRVKVRIKIWILHTWLLLKNAYLFVREREREIVNTRCAFSCVFTCSPPYIIYPTYTHRGLFHLIFKCTTLSRLVEHVSGVIRRALWLFPRATINYIPPRAILPRIRVFLVFWYLWDLPTEIRSKDLDKTSTQSWLIYGNRKV